MATLERNQRLLFMPTKLTWYQKILLILTFMGILQVLSNTHNFPKAPTKLKSKPNQERIRLYIITVTGVSNMAIASRIQQSWSQLLGPYDQYATICEEGCATSNNTHAAAVLAPITELNSTLVESIRRNRDFENPYAGSWGYRLAQLKFYFGLVNQVRRLYEAGGPMPEWFLVKDDDTYAHPDRLMQLVQGVNFDQEKVSLAGGHLGRRIENLYSKGIPVDSPPMSGSIWPDGGAGWLISRAQAKTLALDYGDSVLNFMVDKIERSQWGFYYDQWIPEIATWGGGKLYHTPSLRNFQQWQAESFCPDSGNSMASIHIKEILAQHGLEKGLMQIDECFKQPFVPLELLKDRMSSSNTLPCVDGVATPPRC